MKIGIIGTGPIGSTLAKKLGNAGHEIKVTSKSSEHELSETAKKN
ncbi:NAD(P)-binding domain-containing protein [Chryseobacterium arachidis]